MRHDSSRSGRAPPPFPCALPDRRGRTTGRLRGCARRLAGPPDRDRCDRGSSAERDLQHARGVPRKRGDRHLDRRRPPGRGRRHRRRPARDRVRAQLHDAAAPSLQVVRTHAPSRRRGRRHEARPRRERSPVGPGGRGRGRHGPLGGHPRRRRDARPRFVRRGTDRSHAAGRLHARVERGGHDPAGRRPDPARPRGGGARGGGRRALRAASRARPARVGRRHPRVLALQVLRTAPGRPERASRAARDLDPVQAASGARRSARTMGDGHAEPRGPGRHDRGRRLPGGRRSHVRRPLQRRPT